MSIFWLVSNLVLWIVVALLGFLLLGALRAVALLRWQVDQLQATTPSRLGRNGLRPGKKAPDFTVPALAGDAVTLHDYAGRQLLLVFLQASCGPCRNIVPELNRLHNAGHVQVLAVHNGDKEAVEHWAKDHRPHFPVALQERFGVSKRYEVFATPFAFLIDERGLISSRGIVSTKQYLGFVLNRAGYEDKEGDGEATDTGQPQGSAADAGESSFSNSKEVDHV
jgi:methylamine dehydrogenase accessory protein MauD